MCCERLFIDKMDTASFIYIIKHSLSIKLSSKSKFKQLTIHFNVAQVIRIAYSSMISPLQGK